MSLWVKLRCASLNEDELLIGKHNIVCWICNCLCKRSQMVKTFASHRELLSFTLLSCWCQFLFSRFFLFLAELIPARQYCYSKLFVLCVCVHLSCHLIFFPSFSHLIILYHQNHQSSRRWARVIKYKFNISRCMQISIFVFPQKLIHGLRNTLNKLEYAFLLYFPRGLPICYSLQTERRKKPSLVPRYTHLISLCIRNGGGTEKMFPFASLRNN